MLENIKKLADIYGFTIREYKHKNNNCVAIEAMTIDNTKIDWIRCNLSTNMAYVVGDTDQCNIWFHRTRPDLKPGMIIDFVKDLNQALELGENGFLLEELIDPEDWQEIAGVHDAYNDTLYTNSDLITDRQEKIYKINVTWESFGVIDVKASSLKEAQRLAIEEGSLPEANYVPDSIKLLKDISG